MKKRAFNSIVVLMLVLGLSLLLYPSAANRWNAFCQARAVGQYDRALAKMDEKAYSQLFAEAEDYNQQLRRIAFPLADFDRVPGYETLLNVTGAGIMGYIHIPKIHVELPIYHGTSEEVLQVAVGHVQGTSLPTGGEGTHCVLSAHRGLPSARLFTDLDQLRIGDTFTLTVIDRVLTYEVDQILTVLPQEVEPLYAVDGEDYCTLVTCTPYGINTHRLLVRGRRIGNADPVQ